VIPAWPALLLFGDTLERGFSHLPEEDFHPALRQSVSKNGRLVSFFQPFFQFIDKFFTVLIAQSAP
jgi:hypothetical protein